MTQRPERPWWAGPAAAVAAAAAALGIAALVAPLVSTRSAPLTAVGGAVIDAVPGPVKSFAVATFGTHDKLALTVGTLILLVAFAVGLGTLAVRHRWYGVAGVALFGLLGAVAAWTRTGATVWWGLPSLAGALAGIAALLLLLRPRVLPVAVVPPDGTVGPAPAVVPPDGTVGPARPGASGAVGPPRRRFLGLVAAVLGGAAVAGWAGRLLGQRRGVTVARSTVRLPAPVSPAPEVPVGAIDGLAPATPFVTSARTFYLIDTALVAPQVDPRTWRLRIHGRVRRPLTLTFDQLLARPLIERYVTLACVSNDVGGGLIGNARWLGVRLADLLDEAGPLDGADQVVSRSVDGFTAGTPTAVLRDGRDAMLAVGMNGDPLPVAHGFPVRMIVPGLYGYVSATKWLTELELSSFSDFSAYWVRRGWSAQAPIKTESRIDTPRDGRNLKRGTIAVAGVAWAQHRGVSAVQVQVVHGPWQAASLGPVPSVDTWRQWVFSWPATAGSHVLRVRATDNAGAVQTPDEAPPEPDGATGWHTVRVTVG